MKSYLSGWETKLHSFYLSQTGTCSKITRSSTWNRSFEVIFVKFDEFVTPQPKNGLSKIPKNSNIPFSVAGKFMSPKKFRNFIITGNWVILTYKSAIHGKGSFSQIIFSFRGFYSPVKHDILSLSRLKIISSRKDLDFETLLYHKSCKSSHSGPVSFWGVTHSSRLPVQCYRSQSLKWLIFEHDKSGALFVFGGVSGDISSFAFGVLPIIIFFSMTISILYYIGFMTYIITKVSFPIFNQSGRWKVGKWTVLKVNGFSLNKASTRVILFTQFHTERPSTCT